MPAHDLGLIDFRETQDVYKAHTAITVLGAEVIRPGPLRELLWQFFEAEWTVVEPDKVEGRMASHSRCLVVGVIW